MVEWETQWFKGVRGEFYLAHIGKGRCCFCLYARIAEKAVYTLIQLIVTFFLLSRTVHLSC